MRQAAGKGFPGCAGVARSIYAQPAVTGAAKLVGVDRDDIGVIRLAGMDNDWETKIGRESIRNIYPIVGMVVGAIQAPVILQEEAFGTSRMHRDFMHTLTELRILIGHEFRADTAILGCPSSPAVFGPIYAAGRNCHVHTLFVAGINDDGMQGQAAVAGHPARAMRMIEQTTNEGPSLSRVAGFEERGRFDTAI